MKLRVVNNIMKDKTLNTIISLLIFLSSYCNAQTSDFIVTKSLDTIYVDRISLTDSKVKTETNGKKVKYNIDEIISYYIFKENKYYERVKNPSIDKIKAKQISRYDYRELERIHLDDYEKRIEYKFFHRLTNGKVKLFTEGLVYTFTPSPGNRPVGPPDILNNKSYYISIYDSKLELIDYKADLEFFNNQGKLKLTKDVYELLKVYLYGNVEIENKLDQLFLLKPVAKEEQIIDLINEYNIWADTKK